MLPKTGRSFGEQSYGGDAKDYASCIALALRRELGPTHQAVKCIRRWTGAGERTVNNWLAAEHGPSGPHLAQLAYHSDAVLEAFLMLAGRERVIADFRVQHLKRELIAALGILDRLSEIENSAGGAGRSG